jgi:hypothetical protein
MPAAVPITPDGRRGGVLMMVVMIGIDPHKGSHTAVAIDAGEVPLGRVRIRACPDQAGQLLAWARAWPDRTWAARGATGLGAPAGPAAGRRWRAGAGHPAPAGRVQRRTPGGPRHDCPEELLAWNHSPDSAILGNSARRPGATGWPGRARLGEAADAGLPCYQPSLNGDSCGENSRGS